MLGSTRRSCSDAACVSKARSGFASDGRASNLRYRSVQRSIALCALIWLLPQTLFAKPDEPSAESKTTAPEASETPPPKLPLTKTPDSANAETPVEAAPGPEAGANTDGTESPAAAEAPTAAAPSTQAEANTPAEPSLLTQASRQLDRILAEAAMDLGLKIPQTAPSPTQTPPEALTRKHPSWTIAASLTLAPEGYQVEIRALPPNSKVVLLRTETIAPEELEVRPMVMLRELVRTGQKQDRETATPPGTLPPPPAVPPASHSQGRAVLALGAALVGGYVGFSLQKASGSDDARLAYPLMALGAGLGLGSSMLVADEWDVTLGDAWYLSAGALWPTLSAYLLAESYGAKSEDRHAIALSGAAGGLALATVAISFDHISEGGALLTHSGGAFGLLLGAVGELAYEGSLEGTPTRGMGFGSGIGVLAGGIAATQFDLSASRMLMIDLAASLGALTGAALASPLLFVDDDGHETRERIWLGTLSGSLLVGAGLGVWFTREQEPKAASLPMLPYFVALPNPEKRASATWTAGVQGRF